VEELASVAQMGVSTLHHHFRSLTAMSPLQYQKRLRLHAARVRMMTEGLDAASAAFEVGYESASQFNREYSRFFGQRRCETSRRAGSPLLPPPATDAGAIIGSSSSSIVSSAILGRSPHFEWNTSPIV